MNLILIISCFVAGSFFPGEPDNVSYEVRNYETSIISGKVEEFVKGEALTGVEVTVLGSDKSVYTNFDGEFVISGLNSNQDYTLEIRYISYKKKIIRGIKAGESGLVIKLKNADKIKSSGSRQNNPTT